MSQTNNQVDAQQIEHSTVIQIGQVNGGVIHAGSGDVVGGNMTVTHQSSPNDD